jgi:DnaJ-class molecular chaperone
MTRPASAADECFADEIAIDFPSVDTMVARVRDSFLGEPADAETLTTEVSVSTRQATRGVVLPLEVPLRGTCEMCGGRGETWTEPCRACCGTGHRLVHHALKLSVPPGVSHGARFRFRINSPNAAPVRVEVRVTVKETAA